MISPLKRESVTRELVAIPRWRKNLPILAIMVGPTPSSLCKVSHLRFQLGDSLLKL